MMSLSLAQIADIVDGQLIAEPSQASWCASGVSLDSRHVDHTQLFFAIVGEQFDGHHFVLAALDKGARAVITQRHIEGISPQIVVSDTKIALGALAKWTRQQLSLGVVAMTGSSGKTSIKELTASILTECGSVLATKGNLNNDLGVPLTLLRLDASYQFAVVELGASQKGDIAYTSALVQPDAVLISNVAAAHLAGFGSIEGVARTKGEIFSGLTKQGRAIINLDSCYVELWQAELDKHLQWRYSLELTEQADFYALDIQTQPWGNCFRLITPFGEVVINLPLLGRHNVSNALGAAALAMTQGADLVQIKRGLEKIQATAGRLFPIRLKEQGYLLDDSYNANIGSVTAAMQTLHQIDGYCILVLGDLAELGVNEQAYHQQLGKSSQQFAIDEILTIGSLSQYVSAEHQNGQHFKDKASLVDYLMTKIARYTQITILVKGSRSAAMEEIVQKIQEKIAC